MKTFVPKKKRKASRKWCRERPMKKAFHVKHSLQASGAPAVRNLMKSLFKGGI